MTTAGKTSLAEHYGSACQRNPAYMTAIPGSIVMGNFVHQQNLAHCRRLLAEAELATSGDEIRHSMLMRLLAEEEANGLLIGDDGDQARPAAQ
jgi:hypothetical protein